MISISHFQRFPLKVWDQLLYFEQVGLMHVTGLPLPHQVGSTFVSPQVTFSWGLKFKLSIPTRSNLHTWKTTILILLRRPLWFFSFCLGFLTLKVFSLVEWCLLLRDLRCPFILVSLMNAGSNYALVLCLSNSCINANE